MLKDVYHSVCEGVIVVAVYYYRCLNWNFIYSQNSNSVEQIEAKPIEETDEEVNVHFNLMNSIITVD